MADNLVFEGLSIAPGVLDTMVRLAVEQVKGVAGLGVGVRKTALARAVMIEADEEGRLAVAVHVQAWLGEQLRDLGLEIQAAIADALKSQLGVVAERIDVYIDGLAIPA
ncbi:MAG: Asp23/Gls24 family envelope stress response protein [Actinomycetia bacterium]|nr:Asp23/Gls24 family envelope stress response protein [Actinomycetes bacterium]